VNDRSRAARAPSLWLDPPPDTGPPLEGAVEADVVVIGAGYTGLWTALALRERGADVVVLERDYAGFGASGRNAGHLTPTIGKDLPTLLRLYGPERGGALVRFAETAVEHVETAISERGIDCDYAPAGNVLAGVHPGQRPGLEKAAEAARRLGGAAMRMLDQTELAERGLPRCVACGYLEERGGIPLTRCWRATGLPRMDGSSAARDTSAGRTAVAPCPTTTPRSSLPWRRCSAPASRSWGTSPWSARGAGRSG
jgi:hypothetical protein